MLKIQGKPKSVSKTFRLPKELTKKLDRIACINNISLNQLVVPCLYYALSEISTGYTEKPQEK